MPYLKKEARERQGTRTDIRAKIPESEKGKATEKAGQLFNVAPRYISDAKELKESGPELFKQVENGEKELKLTLVQRAEQLKKH